MNSIKRNLLLLIALLFGSLTAMPLVNPNKSFALSGGEFQANRIIDDGVFFNSGTMSVSDIQNFLNAKVPNCDTNGTQSMSGGSQTRAQWAAANGKPAPPYTCLKNYSQNIPGKNADAYCDGYVGPGTKSAAQIIREVAGACAINPQILLVLLQKEQSLITDDWPWANQFTKATGYGCPDSALGTDVDANQNGCYDEFEGFFNQVYYGARQYQRYARQANLFNYRSGQTSYVAYSPNAACSGTNLSIANQATAGLYNYTPYQPNQAALNNLYGSGDSCSSYGNRNFWRMFSDWFGSPIGCPSIDSSYIQRLQRFSDGSYLYTSNTAEICQAIKYAGYTVDGPALQSIGAADTDSRSVYRLSRNSNYLYTANPSERDIAMQVGYRYEGVAYYASATPQAGYYSVYRLSRNGQYVFTVSVKERDSYQASGYHYEGVVFYSPVSSTKVPVYRLSKNGLHLYTPSDIERALAVNAGYSDEGIAFSAITAPTADDLTVFRMERNGRRLYTDNINEKIAAMTVGYRHETSYFNVYESNYPGTVPVYRLSNSKNGDYLYTTSSAEKDIAVQVGYQYEGVGFNGAP
jgi:hypothetical protein